MQESILVSVKKLLGIAPEYEVFDTDIILHINSALSVLTQLGIGPSKGYMIRDANDLWSDFVKDDPRQELLKVYVYLRVRLIFDPPSSSSVIEAINNQIKESEWRLTVVSDELKLESEEGNQNGTS